MKRGHWAARRVAEVVVRGIEPAGLAEPRAVGRLVYAKEIHATYPRVSSFPLLSDGGGATAA